MYKFVVVLVCSLLAACALGDDERYAESEQEVLVGAFGARFDNVLRGGGVVAQGASLSGREDAVANTTASITVAGIPAGATVHRALLYWVISGGSDTTATINTANVTGVNVATGGQTCWGTDNATFRADVTARVTGNGVYTIGGLPSSTTQTGADTDGVALIVTYQNASSGIRRRVMIRDGAITTSASDELVSDTFTGVNSPIASAGRFHVVVGDGQSMVDGPLTFDGVSLGTNQFSGSDGYLWDTNTYNVNVPAGVANATWSSQTAIDCLVYGAAVLDWNVAVCGDGVRTAGEPCDQGNTMNGDGCSAICNVEPGWTCNAATPSVCTTTCGDGIRAGAETCDDGDVMAGDGCSATCRVEPGWTCVGSPSACTTTCGDGIRAGVETCDDGDAMAGDGCSATCRVEPGWTCSGSPSTCTTTCGDGIRAGLEACDDGDTMSGDGCSAVCAVEPGWTCTGSTPSTCTTTCGDGIRAGLEACDDGDTMSGDGCSAVCAVEPGWTCTGSMPSTCATTCGDGIRAGTETCDDGDTMNGDGCSATCRVEPGWTCTGSPSTCTTTCGDGIRAGLEACDDGDTMNGDGCSAVCAVEPGWTCTGSTPSTCTTTCGDGIRAGVEACDDGDTMAGDGCSATCTVEPGWTCTGIAPSVCTTTCGDGVVAGNEACDDSDMTNGDGCSATCTVEPGWSCTGSPSTCTASCGDGIVAGSEACDDGNATAGDGCTMTCAIEPGWSCTGMPSTCTPNCGDGQLAGAETCDDGNTQPDDGCDAACMVEPGWTCTGAPSACVRTCGDGVLLAGEACDDGNAASGDGCSNACALETGWLCDEQAPTTCERLQVAGGCAAAGGSSGVWMAGLVLLLLAIGSRRRRRRLLVAGAGLVMSSSAMAQTVAGSESYSAERFQLAMDRDGILGTEAATVPGHLVFDVGLWLGYANDPLTVRVGDDRERVGALVHHRVGGELVASVGLGERFQVGVDAPLILSQSDSLGSLMTTTGELASVGLGDLALTPKVVLVRGGVELAVAARLTLPTSGGDDYLGEDGVTITPVLLAGRRAGAWRVLANLGYRSRGAEGDGEVMVDDELLARLAVGYRAASIDVMGELGLATLGSAPFDLYNANHGELRLGAGYDVSRTVRVFASTGFGLASGYGTPDWRALAGVWFGSGRVVESAPVPREPTPDPDADRDGVAIPTDRCPAEPETNNAFQDDDGCPDEVPDTDADGLRDPDDKCADRAEDKDAFQDDDGCPDDDNDADGVADASDRCPVVAGVVDNGGCPDTDRDADTVVDRLDNCPDEPGTVKNRGCKEKQLVAISSTKIELLDVVYFETNQAVIQKRSFKLLRNVANVIKAHPEITKVTVEGHTDDQGDDATNKELSQRRAAAVVAFLTNDGVSADKLEPIGFGEEKPVQDNTTATGRAANRRVEFKVTSAPVPTTMP